MTSPASGVDNPADLPDYAPVPRSSLGPALNDQGYYVGRVERNLYWVTDGVYQSAFLTTPDGVVLFDAPPSIGGNLQRAVDQITAAEGVTNTVTQRSVKLISAVTSPKISSRATRMSVVTSSSGVGATKNPWSPYRVPPVRIVAPSWVATSK